MLRIHNGFQAETDNKQDTSFVFVFVKVLMSCHIATELKMFPQKYLLNSNLATVLQNATSLQQRCYDRQLLHVHDNNAAG